MEHYIRKKIAPVIVSICVIGYYLLVGFALIKLDIPNIIKIAALIVSIALTVTIIFVLVERIKEINRGEEDDLGKY